MIDSINARAEERARLATLMAKYEGRIIELPPAGDLPRPPRSAWVDPEAKLKRNDRYIRPLHSGMLSESERKRLRSMAQSL